MKRETIDRKAATALVARVRESLLRVREAVRKNDRWLREDRVLALKDDVIDAIAGIDRYLTGHQRNTLDDERAVRRLLGFAEPFHVHLSDGGYSRLTLQLLDDPVIALDRSLSRPDVVERWAEIGAPLPDEEQLADGTVRTWLRTGRCYTQDRRRGSSWIREMPWQPLSADREYPMMPGLMIEGAIREFRIPRVSEIAISHEAAPYGLYGIRGAYANGRAELYLIDEGDVGVPIVSDFHPKEVADGAP